MSFGRTRRPLLSIGIFVISGVRLHQFHGPVLFGAAIGSINQGHGLQVVAPANRWFGVCLERDEKLRHGSDERIGKPTLFPGWAMEIGIALARIAQGRRSRVGILAPTN